MLRFTWFFMSIYPCLRFSLYISALIHCKKKMVWREQKVWQHNPNRLVRKQFLRLYNKQKTETHRVSNIISYSPKILIYPHLSLKEKRHIKESHSIQIFKIILFMLSFFSLFISRENCKQGYRQIHDTTWLPRFSETWGPWITINRQSVWFQNFT